MMIAFLLLLSSFSCYATWEVRACKTNNTAACLSPFSSVPDYRGVFSNESEANDWKQSQLPSWNGLTYILREMPVPSVQEIKQEKLKMYTTLAEVESYIEENVTPLINSKANSAHTHSVSEVVGLTSILEKKLESVDVSKTVFKIFSGKLNASTGEITISLTGFNSIIFTSATAYDPSGNIVTGSFAVVKSESTSSITLKFIRGKNQGVLLAGAFDTTQASGALDVKILVFGTKN